MERWGFRTLLPRSPFKNYRLRRPFNGKIRVETASVVRERDRAVLLAALEKPNLRLPLETSLRFLGLVYAGRHGEANALLGEVVASGLAGRYTQLMLETDFRSFLIACFRDFVASHGDPPKASAALLLEFSQLFGPALAAIQPGVDARPRSNGSSPPPLVRLDYAPEPPRSARVSIYIRKHFSGRKSRLHDVGPRLKTAFDEQGVPCTLLHPAVDAVDIAPCDLALVDDELIFRKDPGKKQAFLRELRSKSRVVGMIESDAWVPSFEGRASRGKEIYDFVWTTSPSLAKDGRIHGLPACLVPFPTGFGRLFDELADSRRGTRSGIGFCGAVESYNFHRYFWVLANSSFRRPFGCEITSHANDDRSVEASLRDYLSRLLAPRACLNFTMRRDGKPVLVGRTFDALRGGQLVVQEFAGEMQSYFIPNLHYLEFECVPELEELCFKLSEPDAFEEVRRAGISFYQERYSDAAIVRHLATWIDGPRR